MDKPFKDIANSLNISVGTVYNVYRLFQETGEVSPKTPYTRYDIRKLDYYHENYILCLISKTPNLYLSEIVMKVFEVTGVSISISTVFGKTWIYKEEGETSGIAAKLYTPKCPRRTYVRTYVRTCRAIVAPLRVHLCACSSCN